MLMRVGHQCSFGCYAQEPMSCRAGLSLCNSENNVTKFRATRKYGQVNETWHFSLVSDVGPTGPVYSWRLLRMTVCFFAS